MEKLVLAWGEWFVWWWAVVVLLSFAALESVYPGRASSTSTIRRWAENFSLYAAGIGVRYLVGPDALAKWIVGGAGEGPLFGTLHRIGGSGLVLAVGIFTADIIVFCLHIVEHRYFVLWRIHAVHHTDQDLDVTSGLRHHPAEFVLNALIANVLLIGLGQPFWVSGVYAILSTTLTLFNHSNVKMPEPLDRAIRAVFVTPRMHRVHHSIDAAQYNSNFGNVFSFWDRLCGTYRYVTPEQEASIAFGIEEAPIAPRFGLLHEWLLPVTLRRPRSEHA